MKINPAPLHLAQTVVTGLVVALSIAILGTSAHTLDVFNKQHTTNPWWMPLWPQHFVTQGTKALIASSVITLVLSAAFLILSLLPKVSFSNICKLQLSNINTMQFNLRQKHTLRTLIAFGASLPAFLLTLMTVVWAHVLNHNAPDLDTIQTWTCRYQNQHSLPQDTKFPSNMGNGSFKSLCSESKFALYGTLVVFLLLGASMGLTLATWMAEKWAARQQRKEGAEMGSLGS